MRISEIFKRTIAKKGLPEKKETVPVTSEEKEILLEKTYRLEEKKVILSEVKKIPAEQVYGKAISCVKKVLTSLEKDVFVIDSKEIEDVANKIIDKIVSGDEQIITLVNKSTPDNYLYAHSVNVCILVIKLAASLGWSENKLRSLGIAALLHDSGMVYVLPLASKPSKLSPDEYEEIKKHPLYGKEILEKLDNEIEKGLKELIVTVAYEEHERINGQGYPRGLKDKGLSESAKIIGLVDTYEGLTHPRSYRERMLPHLALRYLIETSEEQFEAKMLKIFIEELSLYPLGSFVKLNTEEIGEVVKSNRKFPTRPVIKVILNGRGEKMEPAKFINLSETPILHIREPVDETKLKIADKELVLKLKVRRWWIP